MKLHTIENTTKTTNSTYSFMGRCVRERRAMILGQKVAAERPSSSQVRVHQPDKARTGAEKNSGLRFLATEAHPPRQLREGGRVKKRSPSDPARQGGPVDNRAAGTQLADHPKARQYSSLQESFSISLTRISWCNEPDRFSMGQMKSDIPVDK